MKCTNDTHDGVNCGCMEKDTVQRCPMCGNKDFPLVKGHSDLFDCLKCNMWFVIRLDHYPRFNQRADN